jgi:hypothetical protein
MSNHRDSFVTGLFQAVAVAGAFAIVGTARAQFAEPVNVIHAWNGEQANDRFGRVNRIIGDVDRDGVSDIAVASPHNSTGGTQAGKVYIFSGASGDLIRSHIGQTQWNFGNELAAVGDIDGDDVPDYIVGAPSGLVAAPVGPGRAFLYSGIDGSEIHCWIGEADGDLFGRMVAGAGNEVNGGIGDIDGDSVPDILIGAPNHDGAAVDAGRVYVYSGANVKTPYLVIDGEDAGDTFGFGIGGLGDVDKDGFGDFVVGAPQRESSGAGRAYAYSGASGGLLLPRFDADATGNSFGLLFASGPGDVNQDGTLDIFVSDLGNTALGANTGRAYVFSGLDGSGIHTFTGAVAGEGLGVGRGCDDVNFDGSPDLLITAFRSSAGNTNAGRAFVFSGEDGSVLRTITNTIAFDFFGWSAVGAGDIDGDLTTDFLISAALSNANGFESGRVYLIAGDIEPTPGDLDGDGMVGITDLLLLLAAWGPCPDPCPPSCAADFDGDCAVGIIDLLVLLANWG